MEKTKMVVDIRNVPNIADRPEKVSREFDKLYTGQHLEIVTDDERMLHMAPIMVASMTRAKFINSWKGDDGFYHTLIVKE